MKLGKGIGKTLGWVHSTIKRDTQRNHSDKTDKGHEERREGEQYNGVNAIGQMGEMCKS